MADEIYATEVVLVDGREHQAGERLRVSDEVAADLEERGLASTEAPGAEEQADPIAETDVDALKGQDLIAALEERGLSTSGNAEAKRRRVAEHDAALAQEEQLAAERELDGNDAEGVEPNAPAQPQTRD